MWGSCGGGGGGGSVTSVGLTLPSWLTVAGTPITTSGTFTVTPTTAQTSHQVIGTCGAATTFAPCALIPGDLPTATGSTQGIVQPDGTSITISGGIISAVGGGGGSVTNVATTTPITGGPITTTGTVSCPTCVTASSPSAGVAHFAGSTQAVTSSAVALTDLVTQIANTIVMNATGSTAVPTAVVMPTCTTGADLYNTTTHAWSCVSTSGAVSSVSNSDGSITITPTTGSVVASVNLAHANTWAGTQTFSGSGIPIASGTPSNTDLTGRVTLSGGTFVYTLVGTYATPPTFIVQDATTPANVCSAVETTTTVTFTGTGSDVCKYIGIGLN